MLRARNDTRGTSLGDSIRVAGSLGERLRGLLFHREIAEGEGLWIRPCNSVHSFFLPYPIDVLFLDEAHFVVACVAPLSPWRATRIHLRARSVLELPAGTVGRARTEVGDRLVLEPHQGKAT